MTSFLIASLHSSRRAILLATLALGAGGAQIATAQSADGPCAYQDIDIKKYGMQDFRNPPEVVARQGSLDTVLTIRLTDNKTVSIAGCPVTLRTYNGALVGPTLRIKPGDVMNVRLENQLPKETPNEIERQFQQEAQSAQLDTRPASFNTTNLHTHGLHVSPSGNSDNVLLAIAPGEKFPYEIKTPATHPSGSFWYHAHAHGSTSIQVGSGMAGALIIDDIDSKIPAALREANKREKILMFQTILYNTKGRLDDITALFPSPSKMSDCNQPGNQGTWSCSKRRITINGQIVPVIRMRPGEVQRWRMIDTAFREAINVALQGHDLYEIALDGLYLGKVNKWPQGQAVELQPGYRSDVLVKASKTPGTYRLIDQATPSTKSLRGAMEAENLLALVVVEGAPLDMALPTSADMAPLAPFPGVDLSNKAQGVQQVVFKLGSDMPALRGAPPPAGKNYFQVNYQAFSHTHVRQVRLNQVDVWNVSTIGDPEIFAKQQGIPALPHVFHIHVNPFQYVRSGPNGVPEQVWKDTVLIPPAQPGSTVNGLNLYTQYTDYVGKFVMHCHILDHEDLGMMEVVEVVDQASGVASHH